MTPTHSSLVLYQHFVFGFHGYEASSDIETLIRDYHLGYAQIVRRREPASITVIQEHHPLQAQRPKLIPSSLIT
jgi:hypothetical protein